MQVVDLSNKIKTLCKTKKIPMQSLLEQCNINRNFIYDLERNEAIPSFDKIIRIADCLDVSIDFLACRTNNPNSHKATLKTPNNNYAVEIAAWGGDGTQGTFTTRKEETT